MGNGAPSETPGSQAVHDEPREVIAVRSRHVFGRWLLAGVLTGVAAFVSFAQDAPAARNPRVVVTQGPESFVTRVVTADLAGPWEVTWGPDGFLWITERA